MNAPYEGGTVTFEQLQNIQHSRIADAVQQRKCGTVETDRRKYAAFNGQVLRTGHSDGKRTAERWARNDRWTADGEPGIIGVSSHPQVCRNLKTARLPRYVAPRWKATPPPQPAYVTPDGRKRECGSAGDVRVVGVRRNVGVERRTTVLGMMFGKRGVV